MFIAESLEICDPVMAFDKIMEEIGIERYQKPEGRTRIGRPRYSRVNMLKTILYGFMDSGYVSLRELDDRCKVNLRYMYLMDSETPSYFRVFFPLLLVVQIVTLVMGTYLLMQ